MVLFFGAYDGQGLSLGPLKSIDTENTNRHGCILLLKGIVWGPQVGAAAVRAK